MPAVKYRVRGLTASSPVAKPAPVSMPDNHPPELEPAYRAVDVPRLSDYLPGAHAWGMQRYWPACDFLHHAPFARPVKELPLALAPHLWVGDEDRSFLHRITTAWEERTAEKTAVDHLIATLKAGQEFDFEHIQLPPVAAAFGSYLFRHARSWSDHRDAIRDRVCQKPEAAWLALLSGAWHHDPHPLFKVVSRAPELAVQAWQHPVFAGAASEPLFPVMPWLYFSTRLHDAGGVARRLPWDHLAEAAKHEPRAAAFALGLQPGHPNATAWTDLVRGTPAAMYWAVRVGSSQVESHRLPWWAAFREEVRSTPQWGYHWVRDFEPGTAYEFVEAHWPDPWAIELAVDLRLKKSALVNTYHRKRREGYDDPLHNAVILWCSDYLLPRDDDDEEN